MKYERGTILFNGMDGKYNLITDSDRETGNYAITSFTTALFDVFENVNTVNFRSLEQATSSNDWSVSTGLKHPERVVADSEMKGEIRFDEWAARSETIDNPLQGFDTVLDTTSETHSVYTVGRSGKDGLADDLAYIHRLGNGMTTMETFIEAIPQIRRVVHEGIWMPIEITDKYYMDQSATGDVPEGSDELTENSGETTESVDERVWG